MVNKKVTLIPKEPSFLPAQSDFCSRKLFPGGCWGSTGGLVGHRGHKSLPSSFYRKGNWDPQSSTDLIRGHLFRVKRRTHFFWLAYFAHCPIPLSTAFRKRKQERKKNGMVSPQFSQHAISIIIILTICFTWNRQENLILRN